MDILSHDAMTRTVEETNADLPEPFSDIAKEVFDQAYSQEVSDMFKADLKSAEKIFYENYFCDCLNIPLSVIYSNE